MALLSLCMKVKKNFWPKDFFWGIMKVPFTKIICNLFQGPPNPGFGSVKVQIDTFFKKDLKNSFYLGFLWIPSKPGKQNWKLPKSCQKAAKKLPKELPKTCQRYDKELPNKLPNKLHKSCKKSCQKVFEKLLNNPKFLNYRLFLAFRSERWRDKRSMTAGSSPNAAWWTPRSPSLSSISNSAVALKSTRITCNKNNK